MSSVIFSLLEVQRWQLNNNDRVKDMFTKLGDMLFSFPKLNILDDSDPLIRKEREEAETILKKYSNYDVATYKNLPFGQQTEFVQAYNKLNPKNKLPVPVDFTDAISYGFGDGNFGKGGVSNHQ